MNGFRVSLVLVAALWVAAPLREAFADEVTITDNSWYGDTGITVNAAGTVYTGYPIGPQQVTVTDLTNPSLSATVSNAWCIDFTEDITVPGTYSYNLVSFSPSGLTSVSGSLTAPEPAALLTTNTAGIPKINYLMALGNALLAPGSPYNPGNLYGTQDDIASAIQIAIWEELYTPTAYPGASISYSGASTIVSNDVNSFLTDASNNISYPGTGYALISTALGPQQLAYTTASVAPPHQVPEPGSLVLLGSALAGFAAIRRRRSA
jgi:hypothetical protein